MPLKCFNKPNRRFPRTWNARAVARAACSAVENGVPPAEIRFEMRECVPCNEDQESKRLLNQAIEALAASQEMIAVAIVLISAIVVAMRGVVLIGRFVPQARLALLVLAPAVTRVQGFLGTIIARKAANDAIIAILRRAA